MAAQAGEVEERLLEAATRLFLTSGFEATTCDQVAALANAGKGSLYARFASKEELFAAVVGRIVERHSVYPPGDISHLPLHARLREVGLDILRDKLKPEAVAMMRLIISTAPRFPELTQRVSQISMEECTVRVAATMSAGAIDPGEALKRARPAASWFIALTLAPMQMLALLGEDLVVLQESAVARIDEAIRMLTSGGWFDGWD